jgi:N-acetylated-alpha-linked acidic dipeptidase
MAPEEWRGALPAPYHLGPGPARVHLKLAFNWNLAPIYDVIARIPGSERPDEWVIRGNHHDAWVNGASDPISGMVAELAEARALGELVKSGWKPKRTIIYAAWDGEEPGLLGSTEWAETHADELRQHAAVYINSDSNARGFFGAGGSHQLETFINQVMRDVPDPEKGISVLDRSVAAAEVYGGPERKQEAKAKFLHLEPLGSGSDFTPFLQHLGIAALNIGYGGEEEYGQYHSIYDSFAHYTRFVDPTFEYGVALAKTGGRIVLRLADADVLPFDPDRFATAVGRYADEVQKLLGDLRKQTEERNQRLDDKVYEAVDDPTQKWWVAPKRLDTVPYLSFAPLENAVAMLKASTAAYSKALAAATAGGKEPAPEVQARLDDVLMKAERALTTTQGLPRRSWYVHQIYAPGYYTGYGVKTLPAVREAIEQRQWKEAEQQMSVVAGAIQGFAREVDRATTLLGGAPAAAGQ